jgi:hypothetical protein
MRTFFLTMLLVVSASAASQQPPPAAPRAPASPVAPPPEQLEPAVDTTAASSPPAEAPQRQPSASRAPARAAAVPAPAPPPKGPARAKGPDRVELETTDITGNRELPKVLYIVPWRRSDLGDLVGKPPNSLLDDVLQPIDREVFLRENRYYDAVKPDAATGRAGAVPGSGDKP